MSVPNTISGDEYAMKPTAKCLLTKNVLSGWYTMTCDGTRDKNNDEELSVVV